LTGGEYLTRDYYPNLFPVPCSLFPSGKGKGKGNHSFPFDPDPPKDERREQEADRIGLLGIIFTYTMLIVDYSLFLLHDSPLQEPI
jgi:hypothetical protein